MDRRNFIKKSLIVASGAILLKSVLPTTSRENKKMKILVLTGSPRKNGNSNTLVDNFIKGATEIGHNVVRFDSAFKKVHPCVACNKCGMNGDCVFNDDFNFVKENIVDADMVVFATPMYYFGISAQLKTVIDRFYSINGKIHVPKKAALFLTYADNSKIKEDVIRNHYKVLTNYLGWEDVAQIVCPGVWQEGAINNTEFVKQAYELGKNI